MGSWRQQPFEEKTRERQSKMTERAVDTKEQPGRSGSTEDKANDNGRALIVPASQQIQGENMRGGRDTLALVVG